MKRAFQDEVQGIAVVMAMTMVMTILIASATEKRTLVVDAAQEYAAIRILTATTAQLQSSKTHSTTAAHLASVKERALLKNHKDRVLLLLTNKIAVRVLNTQGGASAQEDHSAKVVGALPTRQQQQGWR